MQGGMDYENLRQELDIHPRGARDFLDTLVALKVGHIHMPSPKLLSTALLHYARPMWWISLFFYLNILPPL
jgi:hypothetical protein